MRLGLWLLICWGMPCAALAQALSPGGSFGATYIEDRSGGAIRSSALSFASGAAGLSIGFEDGLGGPGDRRTVYGSLDLMLDVITLRLGRPHVALERPGVTEAVLPIRPPYPDNLSFGMQIAGQQASYSFGASFHRTEAEQSVYGVRARYSGEALTVYGSALTGDDADQLQVGTALTYGQATAGVDLAFSSGDDGTTQSRFFVDYGVSRSITLGVVGRRDFLSDADAETSLGVSAAYETASGGILRGGVAKAPDSDPLLGLSIGFDF